MPLASRGNEGARMPRYHFDIPDGKPLVDEHGTELANIDIAKAEAIRLAGEVFRHAKPDDIWALTTWKLVVNDHPSPGLGQTYFSLVLFAKDGGFA
jgi:uncharacterized protein DUF6894